MKRLLSTVVRVKAAPSVAQRAMAKLAGREAALLQPNEREVRDALGRVTRSLEDMRLKRGSDWAGIDGSFGWRMQATDEGEVVLRGWLAIERAG